MKILLVPGRFYPDAAGSAAATFYIALELQRLGHNITVMLDAQHPDIHRFGFNTILINGYKDFLTEKSSFTAPYQDVIRYIAPADYDVIHVFSFISMHLLDMHPALGDSRVFFTFWNAPKIGERYIGYLADHAADTALARHIVRNASYDKLLSGSINSHSAAIALGADNVKASFYYHGIDHEVFTNTQKSAQSWAVLRKYYDIGQHTYTVCIPSRIVPRKGVDTAIAAVSALRKLGYDVELLLTRETSSDYCQSLKQLIHRNGLEDHILFAQRDIDLFDMHALYQQSHACLALAEYEGLGFTAIEAMTSRCPVIATNVPGLDEVANTGNSTVVEYSDTQAVVDGLIAIFRQTDDVKQKTDQAELSCRRFDMKRFVQAILEQYYE